jgi:hypothetical protein
MGSCFRALLDPEGTGRCGLAALLERLAELEVAATLLEAKELLRWMARGGSGGSGHGGGPSGGLAGRAVEPGPAFVSVAEFASFVNGPEPGMTLQPHKAPPPVGDEGGDGWLDEEGEEGEEGEGAVGGESEWEKLLYPAAARAHAAAAEEQRPAAPRAALDFFPPDSQGAGGVGGAVPAAAEWGFAPIAAPAASGAGAPSRRKSGAGRKAGGARKDSGRQGGGSARAATAVPAAFMSSVPRAELDDLLLSLEQHARCACAARCAKDF